MKIVLLNDIGICRMKIVLLIFVFIFFIVKNNISIEIYKNLWILFVFVNRV